jgi:hypothetical protein
MQDSAEQHGNVSWIKEALNILNPQKLLLHGQKERHAVNPDGSPNISNR